MSIYDRVRRRLWSRLLCLQAAGSSSALSLSIFLSLVLAGPSLLLLFCTLTSQAEPAWISKTLQVSSVVSPAFPTAGLGKAL